MRHNETPSGMSGCFGIRCCHQAMIPLRSWTFTHRPRFYDGFCLIISSSIRFPLTVPLLVWKRDCIRKTMAC